MQPKTSRRAFLRATATLALGKVLDLLRPRAAVLAQEAGHERPEKPARTQELAWSNDEALVSPDLSSDGQRTIKLVVTNMATNQQAYLVLDTSEDYLVELSVS